MDLNKPLNEYNRSELKQLVILIKGPLRGRVKFRGEEEKIAELNNQLEILLENNNFSGQLIDNIYEVKNYIEEVIIKQHSFGTDLIVLNVWRAIHGQQIQNRVDNILDKFGRY